MGVGVGGEAGSQIHVKHMETRGWGCGWEGRGCWKMVIAGGGNPIGCNPKIDLNLTGKWIVYVKPPYLV